MTPSPAPGVGYTLRSMPSSGQREPAANNVVGQLEFERVLSEISSRFVNLAPADVEREIGDALQRVCEHLDIDFAALWQWSDVLPACVHGHPPLPPPRR